MRRASLTLMHVDLPMDRHWLRSALLSQVPGLTHGFSTRLRAAPGHEPDLPEPALGVEQVHQARILVPGDDPQGTGGAGCDGLATAERGLALAVRTADCVPLLLADREGRAAAALHAGWRGTLEGIAAAGVRLLESRFGVPPGCVLAALGPAIGACCFEVGVDVAQRFAGRFGQGVVLRDRGPRPHVDLLEANRRVLQEQGVSPEAIEALHRCTVCRDDLFPSFRREGESAGRLWSFVCLAPS